MPVIDWTSPAFLLILASTGAFLIVVGILFYFLPPARLKGLALVIGIVGGLSAGTALGLRLVPVAPPANPDKSVESPPPASVEPKTPTSNAPAWYTVRRGDVVLAIVERGALESADNADVVVKVHAPKPGSPATTIKWIVDDGAMVKKGQLLVELDDAELTESLKAQKLIMEQAKIDLEQTQKQAELDREQAELDLEEAQHQLTVVERELKAYTGGDAERKKGLDLKVKQARQRVKTRDFQTTTAKTRGDNVRRTAQAIFEAESAKTKDLETEIANCKMNAPREGIVFHHVPTQRSGDAVAAQGDPVHEGQKLLYIPDLSKMQVDVRVHEARIARVRRGQTAGVRVDAFPGRTLTGQVSRIATLPARPDRLASNEKVYPVIVTIQGETAGLKPGMSAEIRIELERRTNVVRVPVQAVRKRGNKTFCFVKSGEEMLERQVTIGLSDDLFAEITEGLKEGEQVLHNPPAVKPRGEDAAKTNGRTTDKAHRTG